MDHCWFTSNNATASDGGGVMLLGTVDARMVDSMVSGNTAAGQGGGIAMSLTTGTDIEHTTINGNTAALGGGGVLESCWDPAGFGPTRFYDDLIVGNRATNANGGGILSVNEVPGVHPLVDFCTFSLNNADSLNNTTRGGAIWHAGITVTHSILWANVQSAPGSTAWEHELGSISGPLTVLHSDVQNSSAASWFSPTNLDVTPQFVAGSGSPCTHASLDLYHLVQTGNACVNKVTLPLGSYPSNRSTHPDHSVTDAPPADIGFHYPGPGCI